MTIPNTPEGRRNRLDHLLNRLVDAEYSVGFYQRESEKLRKEIHVLLEDMERQVSEVKKEPTLHWLESGTLERYRCRCGKEFPGPTEFYQHMEDMKSPIPTPNPYKHQVGDGHP